MKNKINGVKKRQQSLQNTIKSLSRNLPEESSTRKQLEIHQELFDDAVRYFSNSHQKLAFIGSIGIGKTTVICHLLGLLKDGEPILSTGSGRTTLCEVEISTGNQLKIEVTPHSKEEVINYLKDFAQYLYTPDNVAIDSQNSFKLSAEVERALRNMLNLRTIRQRNSDGQRITIDYAKKFATKYHSPQSLTEALLKRMNLDARQETSFVYGAAGEQNEWLQTTFKAINSCTLQTVGLAKHIHVYVPKVFFDNIDYTLSVVDTKGVDETVNRTDLDAYLISNRAINVLCCRFNEAPDKTMVGLLKLVKNAGLNSNRIANETILLILDRDNEAENVIDIDEPIGDRTEGREIRHEQVASDLRHALQLDGLDIYFFDIKSDDPNQLNELLVKKVSALREQCLKNIADIEKAVADIETEIVSKADKSAQKQVRATLKAWIKKAQAHPPQLKEYFLPLINDIKDKGTYASSVRASINRRGEWHNLDYYQLLAASAREQVVETIGALQDEFIVLIDNMLNQDALQPAFGLLKQLKQATEKRLGDIYQEAFTEGRAAYEDELIADGQLWRNLSSEWGKGSGYKVRVSGISSDWFVKLGYQKHEALVTKKIQAEWLHYVKEVQDILGADE